MYNSLLKDIKEALMPTGIQIETGVFSEEAPDEYLVIIPMGEIYDFFADDLPNSELQEARLFYNKWITKLNNRKINCYPSIE